MSLPEALGILTLAVLAGLGLSKLTDTVLDWTRSRRQRDGAEVK